MPIYEYECPECEKTHELLYKSAAEADENPPKCPDCKGPLERMLSVSNFKINGYSYKNNYSKPSEKRIKGQKKSK